MHTIKVRGVIIWDNKIFLVRENQKHFFYLPGGTLEEGESFRECLKREMQEELGVIPMVGELLSVREFQSDSGFYLDIWFGVENPKDFININKKRATHAFEYYDEGFYGFDIIKKMDLKPSNLEEILTKKQVINFL